MKLFEEDIDNPTGKSLQMTSLTLVIKVNICEIMSSIYVLISIDYYYYYYYLLLITIDLEFKIVIIVQGR